MSETFRSRVILLFLLGLPLLALTERRRPGALDAAPTTRAPMKNPPPPGPLLKGPHSRADLAQQAWFVEARRQLGALGAVYMRLERWDGDGPVYQFRCDLRAASIGPPGKTFEALSSSPQAATLHVLREARRWHATTGDAHMQGQPVRVASPPIRTLPGALTPDGRTD